MLNTPSSPQPCSSSPISRRSGSALRCRLARAGQPEEQGHVAALPHVRGAVHREHALLRQQVVQNREHRLLDLAGVVRAANDHELLLEADGDANLGLGAVAGGMWRGSRTRAGPSTRGLKFELFGRRPQEQAPGEQAVPRLLGDDAQRQPVSRGRHRRSRRTRTARGLQVRPHTIAEPGEHRRVHRLIRGPVDLVRDDALLDRELVLRRAAVRLPVNAESAPRSQDAFASADGVFDECCRCQIGKHEARFGNTELSHIESRNGFQDHFDRRGHGADLS